MNEQLGPRQEVSMAASTDYEALLRQVQPTERQDVDAGSPERQSLNRESLAVTYLNTSFSGAFDHPEELDGLLLRQDLLEQGLREPRENAIFGFSEVTHAQRPAIRAALEERGYQVVEPPEDSHLDLVWAVSPQLLVEGSDAHHFPRTGLRRVASRTGGDHYRHVGIQGLTVATPQGSKIRLGQERLSPWLVEPVRRMQLRDMGQVLQEQFPPDDDILLTLNGGDMNHIGPFRRPDRELWGKLKDEQGWEPMLEAGTTTHFTGDKYRASGRVFKALGRKSDETQLDAVYARPRPGNALVNVETAAANTEMTVDQIGYTTRTVRVKGTDHYAIETTFSLPAPGII